MKILTLLFLVVAVGIISFFVCKKMTQSDDVNTSQLQGEVSASEHYIHQRIDDYATKPSIQHNPQYLLELADVHFRHGNYQDAEEICQIIICGDEYSTDEKASAKRTLFVIYDKTERLDAIDFENNNK